MKILSLEEAEKLLRHLDLQVPSRDSWGLGIPKTPLSKAEWKRIRNVTAFLFMLDAGLRVGEVVRLAWPDVLYAEAPVQTLDLPAHAAKRHQPRSIPLSVRLQQAILRFKNHSAQFYDHNTRWPLIARSGSGKPITTRTLERIFEAASLKALSFQVNPHMLRHTFATRIMKVTNMPTVQALLGHKHLSSTQRYTHPNSDDKRNAINQLSAGNGTALPGLGG